MRNQFLLCKPPGIWYFVLCLSKLIHHSSILKTVFLIPILMCVVCAAGGMGVDGINLYFFLSVYRSTEKEKTPLDKMKRESCILLELWDFELDE